MTAGSGTRRHVAAIVQARMGSSRLPGKTLEPLGDRTVLGWVLSRLAVSDLVDEVIVATSDRPEDDVIEAALESADVRVVRGSSDDVLDRYRQAAASTDADTIVRITADCPFVDPEIVDHAIRTLDEAGATYVSTSLDGRLPRGLDVEAFDRSALEVAAREAADEAEREHVTLFIYRHPERFRCAPVEAPDWACEPDLRFTLDEPADLELLRSVVKNLPASIETTGRQIVAFLTEHPEIAALNVEVAHRHVT